MAPSGRHAVHLNSEESKSMSSQIQINKCIFFSPFRHKIKFFNHRNKGHFQTLTGETKGQTGWSQMFHYHVIKVWEPRPALNARNAVMLKWLKFSPPCLRDVIYMPFYHFVISVWMANFKKKKKTLLWTKKRGIFLTLVWTWPSCLRRHSLPFSPLHQHCPRRTKKSVYGWKDAGTGIHKQCFTGKSTPTGCV